MGAFSLVVEVGALAIPGVGEAIDGGMSKSDQAEAEPSPQIRAYVNLQQLRALKPRN